jgi:peptidyl-prolyl cis-trans isomerase SurA
MLRIIKALIISFLLCSYVEASVLLDKVVAIVDREIITWSELYKAMSFEYQTEIRSLSVNEKKAYFEQLQKEFLEKLIDMRLQITEARKMGVSVSQSETKTAINDIRGRYGFTLEQFIDALENEGFEYDDYYKRISEQILIQKFVQMEINSKILVSDEEVNEYFNLHKDEMPLEMSYRFLQIKIKNPTDEMEEVEVKHVISEIQENINKGVEFEKIIEMFTGNPAVIYTGDSGFISAKDLRSDLLNYIKGLEEGEITEPLDKKDGIFIIKLKKKQPPVKLEVLRDNIRNILVNKKAEKKYKDWAKSLRQRALIEIKL